ncbi:MAG TPA: type IV conjugative transfer system coupling protein TraD [Gammaproteobacteria bacterium]|nr:type IV conjugative transfer system coupling protein TraD [Gammaproteobacteria bacterium]
MSNYQIEALLRPPVEYFAAGTYFGVAAITLAAPEALMIIPTVAYTTAATLILRGAFRLHAGRRVRRYQKRLWRLPRYQLSSSRLPVSRRTLFLGQGFDWDQRHTQRLADTERAKNRRYKLPPWYYRWARDIEVRYENHRLLQPLIKLTRSDSRWNPVRPLPPIGGNPAIHAVGMLEGEKPIVMDLADRNGHTLVLGTTRVGKTRLLEILVSQDIRRGDVVIVFDPKGDADLLRRLYAEAEAAGRLDELYVFHLGFPDLSARYNAVGNFTRVTEVATRIAGQLPGEGQSQAFREFVWRYVNVIAKALTALGKRPDYEQIKFYGEDIEPLVIDYLTHWLESHDHGDENWRQTIDAYETNYANKEDGFSKGRALADRSNRAMALYRYFTQNEINDFIAHSLIKTFEYERGYLDKLVGSLLPLMEKLCTGRASELLSPNYLDHEDERPIFDWPQLIRNRGIIYIGLDALSDPEVASAVGNAMFADLTAVSGLLYKSGVDDGLPVTDTERPAVSIHADEFNELIGEEFIPLLNKAGGAGFQVTAYTQTWSDVLARLGNTAKAGQVAGNFNAVIMLRVRELETAEMLTKQLKQVEINHLMTVSGATDSSNPDNDTLFVSRTEDRSTTQRVDQIHPNDLTQLPKGQAFALLDGGIPKKIRLPLPDPNDFANTPATLQALTDSMRRAYTTSDSWYRFAPSFAAVS